MSYHVRCHIHRYRDSADIDVGGNTRDYPGDYATYDEAARQCNYLAAKVRAESIRQNMGYGNMVYTGKFHTYSWGIEEEYLLFKVMKDDYVSYT